MTSQVPKTAIVLLIVSLVASMALSTKVASRRSRYVVHPPRCMTLVRAGFNKMLSHIAWMRLIQYRGEMEKVTPDGARDLAKKFDHLTNLDPMFARAYEEGALNIEYTDADAALGLLDKAMEVEKMKNWKIPFTAAFIAKMRKKNDQKALEYINKAINMPDRPSFVKRYAINLEASLPGMDPLKVLNLWIDYYGAGNDRLGMGPNAPVPPGGARAPTAPPMGGVMPFQDDNDRHMVLSRISRLSADIISNAQKEMAAEQDPAKKKALQARIDKVGELVKVVYSGTHICSTCFRPYEPGDRFCKYDGKSVEEFGVCPKCRVPYGKATFCPKCGMKIN
jgi:hypothetical protein